VNEEENMTEHPELRATIFGQVLAELLEERGLGSLDAEEWAKAEEIREEAEHLSGEADELTAELKRRRLSASG
jgi:hypothetical protein